MNSLNAKTSPWGQVYDSITMQPLDRVVVTLRNMLGQSVATVKTDMDGRYAFPAEEPGIYRIIVKKSRFKFPSAKLSGQTKDWIHDNLYFGEEFVIKESGETPTINIPMDQIDFVWDQFKREKEGRNWVREILNMLRAKKKGRIVDATGARMPYAIVSVYSAGIPDMKITQKVADKFGEFYCPVPNGTYIIKVDEKTGEDTYNTVFTSDTIKVAKGMISGTFNVKRMSA